MLIRSRDTFQIFKTCPEIRSHIIRIYLWRTLYWVIFVPCIAVLVVLGIVYRIMGAFCDLLEIAGDAVARFAEWATFPMDWNTRKLIDEAHTILSIEEIQNRTPKLELQYGRILPKDEDEDDHAIWWKEEMRRRAYEHPVERENTNGDLGS